MATDPWRDLFDKGQVIFTPIGNPPQNYLRPDYKDISKAIDLAQKEIDRREEELSVWLSKARVWMQDVVGQNEWKESP